MEKREKPPAARGQTGRRVSGTTIPSPLWNQPRSLKKGKLTGKKKGGGLVGPAQETGKGRLRCPTRGGGKPEQTLGKTVEKGKKKSSLKKKHGVGVGGRQRSHASPNSLGKPGKGKKGRSEQKLQESMIAHSSGRKKKKKILPSLGKRNVLAGGGKQTPTSAILEHLEKKELACRRGGGGKGPCGPGRGKNSVLKEKIGKGGAGLSVKQEGEKTEERSRRTLI